ncbi:MAG: hypothetical protein R3B91_21510 [Planctomycetaceae bacterium]
MNVSSLETPRWSPLYLKVPRTDRSLLCVPPLEEAIPAAEANALLLNNDTLNVQGRPLSHLRRWSREACLRLAQEYTEQLLDGMSLGDGASQHLAACRLFVSGHQPSLYHPGVWVKNFAVDHMARAAGGIGLNLVVDNDILSSTSLRVPTGTRDELDVVRVSFDAPRPMQPWEDAGVVDGEQFRSFAERVAQTMGMNQSSLLLDDLWRDAIAECAKSSRLVDCLTTARHRQERRWGLQNLELPISRMCESEPFLWFASHVLAQLPRFAECHNTVLEEYRELNHVRSRSHPVPALDSRDGWSEAPFWVWRRGEHVRRAVYARQQDHTLTLSDGTDEFARLPLTPEMDACCAVEELKKLPARGIRLRTRALTTTLFARMCLSDLFVHGIGGAKYDEMTDQIIARFFGLTPPSFVTMSATLYLPLAKPYDVDVEDRRRLEHELRDIDFNADRHGLGPKADSLIAEKRKLIAAQMGAQTTGLTRRERRLRTPANRERFQQLTALSEKLAALAGEQRARLQQQLADVDQKLAVNQILTDREFSLALYPPEVIRGFYESAMDDSAS